jgi:predicted PurR-regulated permease PerM
MNKEPARMIKKELSYTLKVWQTTAIVCLSLIIILFVRVAFNILLMTFMGVLIAVYFHGLADFIAQKTKISRKFSLFISIAGTITLLSAMVWIIGSTVQQQAAQLSHTLPQIIDTAKTKLSGSAAGQQLLGYTSGDNSKKIGDAAGTFFSSSFGVIGDLYIILFLGIFFTADPSLYKNSLLAIVPSQQEADGSVIWERISNALKAWMKNNYWLAQHIGIGLNSRVTRYYSQFRTGNSNGSGGVTGSDGQSANGCHCGTDLRGL